MTNQQWPIDIVDWETNSAELAEVRTSVFILEQGVTQEEEIDGLDPQAHHFIARNTEGRPIGCARLLSSGQVGRMAVLAQYRKQGVGFALLAFIIDWHQQHSLPTLFLHAQLHAIPFYRQLGFAEQGPEFMDAGIPHREMVRLSDLYPLTTLEDFRTHALNMIKRARHKVHILSNHLDFPVYNNPEFYQALSDLARRTRHSEIRILLKNTKPIVERGHLVTQLEQRLPSKITLRKLSLAPQNNAMAYLIVDQELLLYERYKSSDKSGDNTYQGFANYAAQSEARRLLEEFTYLWEQHSHEDPQLRHLTL